MKLRNKKTGEIGYLIVGRGSDYYHVCNDDWSSCGRYWSLAELNEEWEDALEEPKDNNYWYIDDFGRIQFSSKVLDEIEGLPNNWMVRKLFGNYFETKEEAEEAVEKLKAWERLKDKGFRFIDHIDRDNGQGITRYEWDGYVDGEDLDLLFSGGEE